MQAWDKFFEVKHAQSEEVQELLNKLLQDLQSINEELAEYINTPSWNLPISSYDDDDDKYSFATQEYLMTCSTAITPDSPKTNSLIMVDKHLDIILETESDKFIKSSVENLVQNPSESEDEYKCDVPDCDDSQTTNFSTFSNPLFELRVMTFFWTRFTLRHQPPDYDSFSLAESPSTFPIPIEDNDSFFKKFDTSLSYSDNSLPKFETFSDHTEKTSSGSTTTHADNSLPEYDSFLFETEPDQGELTSVVIGEPRVYVPNVLPTNTTLMLNSDSIPSDDSLGFDLEVSFPSGTRNKIFDLGIFFEVQSKRFLSPNEFSISFIRDPLSPVFDTLLPFLSENEDNVFNPGSPKLKEHAQLLRLMQFFMGLDDVFNYVRSIILTTEPIHDVKYAFTTLSRDESPRKSDHSKSTAHSLTSNQYQRLMYLLSDTGNASNSHASIAENGITELTIFDSNLESNEAYDGGGDCADIGNEFAPNKSTNEPRVNIIRKNTRKEKYATKTNVFEGIQEYATETHVSEGIQSTSLNDDEYEY
ncbi:hypothetical protein Tco_0312424 [Tanacetum coccineum]